MIFYYLLSSILAFFSIANAPAQDVSVITVTGEQDISFEQYEQVPNSPIRIASESLGVALSAKAAMAADKKTGAILWQKNPDDVRAIGSITKLMTALVFLDQNPNWNQVVTIENQDVINLAKNNFNVGEKITVQNLFATCLISSDNTATQALVRSTGLSQKAFVDLMNQKVKDIGLKKTVFDDPTGLSPRNESTAKEVLKLAQVAFADNYIRNWTGSPSYSFTSVSDKEHKVLSTNWLFGSMVEVNAGKTGFISKSGYCIVSEVTKNNKDLIIVVLGSDTIDDRFKDTKVLANWVWENFQWES